MLTNIRETITEQIHQVRQNVQERREGFDDDHDEVHAELERQLSRRNPRRATERELSPNSNRTQNVAYQPDILDASQTSNLSFDYGQMPFAHAFQMLDSNPPSLDNSQELTLGHQPESAPTPDLASRLSLSLEESQSHDPPAPFSDSTVRTHRVAMFLNRS